MGSRAGRRRRSARCFEDRILSPGRLPYSRYWEHVAVMFKVLDCKAGTMLPWCVVVALG